MNLVPVLPIQLQRLKEISVLLISPPSSLSALVPICLPPQMNLLIFIVCLHLFLFVLHLEDPLPLILV